MDFKEWNTKNYKEYINYLKTLQDIKYRNFNSSLIPNIDKNTIIGIRIPELRKIANKISKSNYEQFLEVCENNYFEETLIQGLVIANIKEDKKFNKYFKEYISKIDNWATCDTFCNSIKIIKENKDYYFKYFSKYITSKKEYEVRCILVIFLNHYLEDKYKRQIFNLINLITIKDYYTIMAIAWLLSYMYFKDKEDTIKYLLNSDLDKFTHNKTIQKIIESKKITIEEKNELLKLKRN